jgi:hypothetical protein
MPWPQPCRRPDNRLMERLAQLSSPVALAVGLLSAAAAVALAVRGPISGLDLALTVTAVAFVATTLVGMAVLRTGPRNLVGWILLVGGAALPLTVFGQVLGDATYSFGRRAIPGLTAINLITGFVGVFGVPLIGLFGLLRFPDGRLAGPGTPIRRRTRWLVRACWLMLAGLVGYALFSPSLVNVGTNTAVPNPIGVPGGSIFLVFVLAIGPVSALTCAHLVGRARAAGTPDQRRALTMAAAAGACIPLAFLACLGVGLAGGATAQIGVIENVGAVAVAAASWYGIIRYGLFDSRAVLSRTLLYGALTVVVVVVYLAASALLRRLFAGDLPAVVAAGLAALAVLPLRDMLQRRVSRLVYGLRNDPVAAFGLLGVRLDATAAPEDVLPAVVRTVGEALRLRCVAIEVGGEEMARWGREVGRRGCQRRGGGHPVRAARTGRGGHGRAHARSGGRRGDPADPARAAADRDRDADHDGRGRLGVRGHARGRPGLRAQGLAAGRDPARGGRGGQRPGHFRQGCGRTDGRVLRRGRPGRGSPAVRPAHRAGTGNPGADGSRGGQRRDRRPSWLDREDHQEQRVQHLRQARRLRPGSRSGPGPGRRHPTAPLIEPFRADSDPGRWPAGPTPRHRGSPGGIAASG